MTYKVCSKCKVEKTLDEFYKDLRNKDGKSSNCKECHAVNAANWKANNPEKVRLIQKAYYAKNAEKRRDAAKKWVSKNRENVNIMRAKWRIENPLCPTSKEGMKLRRLNLHDNAVKQTLRGVSNPPQELIELKRLHLQMKRLIKQQGK